MAQGDAAPQSGITSKKFKDQCSLQFAYLVETFYKTIGDKKKSYTLRTPLSAWNIAQNGSYEGTDGSGSDSGDTPNPHAHSHSRWQRRRRRLRLYPL